MEQTLTLLAFLQSPAPQVICRRRRIVECNHAFAHLFGWRRENLVGESTRVLYPSTTDHHEIGQRFLKLLQHRCHYEDERFMPLHLVTTRPGRCLNSISMVDSSLFKTTLKHNSRAPST